MEKFESMDPRVKPEDDGVQIVFVDGEYQADLSNLTGIADYVNFENKIFSLRLPKNYRLGQAIYINHICRTPSSRQLKQAILIDENAEAIIVESYHGENEEIYENHIQTDIDLKANARLHYYKLQNEGVNAKHHAQVTSNQARDTYLGTYHVVYGSSQSSDRFLYRLNGDGSTCESIGFYQSKNQQKFKIESLIHHLSSNTNSRQLYKGIANDKSHAAFNGKVVVEPNIKEICAHQKNDNLLLSQQAQVDTKPELEIYSDDVQCSHGATVGQLDAEALFYLRSRGVDEETARDLLIDGFANDVFQSFPDKESVISLHGFRAPSSSRGLSHD